MGRNYKLEKLTCLKETIVTKEFGNSMIPKIHSGQPHRLAPVESWKEVNPGDIVYCKVHGNFYTHLVLAKNDTQGVQIGNNKGGINGWTKAVYGKVIEVLPMDYKE